MNRTQLEHLIRAAGTITDQDELIIIGSQSILGQYSHPPQETTLSMEADIIVVNQPQLWNLIDGTLGEGSPFHEQFGYYADGVEENTAILPKDWKKRLIPVHNENTGYTTGLCLELHDLLISKYISARPKDKDFCKAVVKANLVDENILHQRIEHTETEDDTKERVKNYIIQDFKS